MLQLHHYWMVKISRVTHLVTNYNNNNYSLFFLFGFFGLKKKTEILNLQNNMYKLFRVKHLRYHSVGRPWTERV